MSDAAAHGASARRLRSRGDLYEAALHQRRAIALLRGGDPLLLGQALRQLAEILVESGAAGAAEAPVGELLALYQTLPGLPLPERAAALRCAALQAEAAGDGETARAFWAEAHRGYEAIGDTDAMAEAELRIAASRG